MAPTETAGLMTTSPRWAASSDRRTSVEAPLPTTDVGTVGTPWSASAVR